MRRLIAAGVKVQCIVTSPPYWGMRDYGVSGQFGLERTWIRHVARMRGVFRLCRELLADDGVLWLNYGDSYCSAPGGMQGKNGQRAGRRFTARITTDKRGQRGLKSKDLVGMPWRIAFALQDDGWYLRSDVIWHKPNPMPESVSDRPTKAHEYVFLMSKSERYFYDAGAIAEPVTGNAHARGDGVNKKIKMPDGWDTGKGGHGSFHRNGREKGATRPRQNKSFSSAVAGLVDKRNVRTVWTIPTAPFGAAHFATFPPDLVRRCILASTRPGDIVFDPFMGSGTVAQVADELGRRWIGCELNPNYAAMYGKERAAQLGIAL